MGDEFEQDPAAIEEDEAAPAEALGEKAVIAEAFTGQLAPIPVKADSSGAGAAKSQRPQLLLAREPLYRESRGYRMRIEPADLARLRELPGSKGLSDQELGEAFFDGQADRFVEALSEDVPAPAEIRVVVDPYSRQAFLALEKTIRAILSF
jgi:hypothetical protein